MVEHVGWGMWNGRYIEFEDLGRLSGWSSGYGGGIGPGRSRVKDFWRRGLRVENM